MTDTRIRQIQARRVWDSRGRPTVEAEVTLHDGSVGRAIVPAGASTGTREALELRDGGTAFGGLDVQRALGHVRGEIAAALAGHGRRRPGRAGPAPDRARRHAGQDPARRQCHAGGVAGRGPCGRARRRGMPLYRYLGGDGATTLPLPQIQIFGGGAHAGRRVDVQDFMVVCPGATHFAQALEWTAEVYRAAGQLMQRRGPLHGVADEGGWWPDFDSNEQALQTLVQAIETAGYVPARRWPSRSTSRPPSSAVAAATGWRWKRASSMPTA